MRLRAHLSLVLLSWVGALANTDLSGVKVITFDFYAALMNTVSSLKEYAWPVIIQDPVTRSWTQSQSDSFITDWASEYSSYVGIVNALQHNANLEWADKDLFKVMLHSTLEHTRASRKLAISNTTMEALVQTWKKLKPWPNTISVLQALRATGRFTLALLSNGDAEFLRAAAVALPPVDAVLGCDGLGVGGVCLFKPDPAFYNQVRQLLPDESDDEWKSKVLHVAGAEYDAAGSKAFGFHTAWNSMEADPVLFDYTGTGRNVPDFILHDIGELLAVLGIHAEVSLLV